MSKKILIGALALLFCAAPALAEVYSGITVANQLLRITANASAQLEQIYVCSGDTVKQGDVLAELRATRVFASESGVVARIQAEEGQEIRSTVLEVQPVSRYDIYCTVSEAYASTENMLIHSGETLYLRCTANGTHQGTAAVTSIDGETYMAQAIGGEFYNGETVYLYRDPEYTYSSLVGIGTVVAASARTYEADGKILKLHVSEGEYVERGELLYTFIDGDSAEITAPMDGILCTAELQTGDAAQEGQTVFSIVSWDDIRIEIEVEEEAAATLRVGDSVTMTYACDAEETPVSGEIAEISQLGENGSFLVSIRPQKAPPYLGMTVNVQIE